MLKKNLIANYLGQGWTALMGLAFIPLYIKYLGIEAYGLIGLFAVLQAWLALLDMGMTPTLGREMARFTAGSRSADSIRDLLRTVEIISGGIALLVAVLLALAADWIATYWIKANALTAATVAQAFCVMGLVTALRFVEGIYRSAIISLQRQVLLNVVQSTLATLRSAGAVAVLALVSPTLEAFFLWQAMASLLSLFILAMSTYSVLPSSSRKSKFSALIVREIWRFGAGMVLISLSVLLLTNLEKVLLSKWLSLEALGYYMLASVLVGGLNYLSQPINQAFQPRLTALYAAADWGEFAQTFHSGAQLLTIVFGGSTLFLITYSEELLIAWTGDHRIVEQVSVLVSLLATGTLLNGIMGIIYITTLAAGWLRLTIYTNIISVTLLVPAMYIMVSKYAAVGAAIVWVLLNTGYFFVSAHFMFKRILVGEKRKWYVNDVLKPLLAGALGAVFSKFFLFTNYNLYLLVATLATSGIFILLCSTFGSDEYRKKLINLLRNPYSYSTKIKDVN